MKINSQFATLRNAIQGYEANNCVLKAPAKSPFIEACYHEASSRNPKALKWGDIGPKLVNRIAQERGMWSSVAKPESFCPIDWWSWEDLIQANNSKRSFAASDAIHLWNEMWRRGDAKKKSRFHPDSLYSQLQNRFNLLLKS